MPGNNPKTLATILARRERDSDDDSCVGPIVVSDIERRWSGQKIAVYCTAQVADYSQRLWYRIDVENNRQISCAPGYEPFIAVLLGLSMRYSIKLDVHGEVDSQFLFGARKYSRCIAHYFPDDLSAAEVSVQAETLGRRRSKEDCVGALLAFSAGVDSMYSLYKLRYSGKESVARSHRVRGLVFGNVGSHGLGSKAVRVFRTRTQRMSDAADDVGMPLLRVDSNVHDVVLRQEKEYTDRYIEHIASVGLLFQGACQYFVVSSELSYRDGADERHAASSFAAHMLSASSTDVVMYGASRSRIEKLEEVAEWDVVKRNLNVCVKPPSHGGNCSKCTKCVRTMVTLEMLGVLEAYDQVFNLDNYEEKKKSYFDADFRGAENFYRHKILEYSSNG